MDPEVGRRRLRNVVAHVRAAGDLLERNDDLLALGTAVAVDLLDFESRGAGCAPRCPGRTAGRRALAALELCPGEVLPGDRYEDWSVAARRNAPERSLPAWPRLCSPTPRRRATRTWRSWWASALLAADPYADHVADRVAEVLPRSARAAGAAVWAERAQRDSAATWGCERLPRSAGDGHWSVHCRQAKPSTMNLRASPSFATRSRCRPPALLAPSRRTATRHHR